ncbi:MAG: PRD domain-containing protein [Lachnospiraceae bacterium]|jgi:lichenan operon transcriptional antiterminator|nr:PRD domain-containing protein [Lachnospiraceae bacterium]
MMTSKTPDSRIAQILDIMELRKTARLESLADKLDVGTKTIRNDIRELNQLLEGSALIESMSGKYAFFVLDEREFQKKKQLIYSQNDYMNSPAKRYGYILNRLMHEEEAVLIDDLADEICVGRTTINGDLKKLREMLESYQLQIVGKPNTGIHLSGEELKLRLFILEQLYDQVFETFLLDDDLDHMVNEYCQEYGLDYMTTQYFMRSYTLMMDRVLNEHPLGFLQEKYHELEQTMAYRFAEKIITRTIEMLQIQIPMEEILFLSLPIAGMRTSISQSDKQAMEISEEVAELVVKILNRIAYDMNFHISPTDLLDDFVYHINFMLNRLKYRFYIRNYALTEIREKYPLAYKMAELSKKVIEEQTNLVVVDDELGFLASYFSLFLEEQHHKNEKQTKVGIVCAQGVIAGKLIEVRLRKMLPVQTEFELLSEKEARKREDFDLMISTSRKYESDTMSVIYLGEIFDEVEVLRQIERLKYLGHLNAPIKTGLNSLIATILEPEHFYVLAPELSYLEAILYMAEQLIQAGVLPADFKEALLRREEKSTMLFDKEIGFPHLQYKGEKIVLAVGVAERTGPGVRFVLFLALPQDLELNDRILIHIYNELLVISSEKELLDDIAKLKSGNAFVLYMIKHNERFEDI